MKKNRLFLITALAFVGGVAVGWFGYRQLVKPPTLYGFCESGISLISDIDSINKLGRLTNLERIFPQIQEKIFIKADIEKLHEKGAVNLILVKATHRVFRKINPPITQPGLIGVDINNIEMNRITDSVVLPTPEDGCPPACRCPTNQRLTYTEALVYLNSL